MVRRREGPGSCARGWGVVRLKSCADDPRLRRRHGGADPAPPRFDCQSCFPPHVSRASSIAKLGEIPMSAFSLPPAFLRRNIRAETPERCTRYPSPILRKRESRSEEHTSELQSQSNLVCRLLLEKKKKIKTRHS